MKSIKNKKIVVTGGTGFLGSALIPLLKAKGAKVYAPNAKKCNLLKLEDAAKAFKGAHSVIHTAGIVTSRGHQAGHPADIFYGNTISSLNVLEAARREGVKNVVLVGSVRGYPIFKGSLKEELLLLNLSPTIEGTLGFYGLSKWLLIPAARAYEEQYGMNIAIAIFPILYGPGDKFHHKIPPLVPNLIREMGKAAKKGNPQFFAGGSPGAHTDILYIDDACDFLLHLLERTRSSGFEVMNAGAGKSFSIREICATIAKALNFQGKITWSDEKKAPPVFLNIRRAQSIGWKPRTPLHEGIRKTVAWYLEK